MILAILAAVATLALVWLVPALRIPWAIGAALAVPALLYARWWVRNRAWRY